METTRRQFLALTGAAAAAFFCPKVLPKAVEALASPVVPETVIFPTIGEVPPPPLFFWADLTTSQTIWKCTDYPRVPINSAGNITITMN